MDNSELLTRAVEEVVPPDVAKAKLASKKPLRIYLGIDPTGSKLHLGHSVPLRKLKAFQDAGHHVIFLVGNFTAMIGDPTGRDTMRESLTKEQVEANFKTYKEQASLILDFSKVELRYNDEWLAKMPISEVMKLMSNFTVQQMMHRDMFKERVKANEDLSPVELMYPILQGYDSVMLDVDFEIGGNDQLFNMLCGRKLQNRYEKREKCVLTTKLIEGSDGRKMSKTYDNCIYLTDTPEEMYGKTMSILDSLIPIYMECCTDMPMTEVKAAEKAIKTGSENPKMLKMKLARTIVAMYHSEKAAKDAEAAFENIFKNKGVPDDMPEYKAKKGESLIDALVTSGSVKSKSEARRLIEQGGVSLNDKKVSAVDAVAEKGVVKVGKRKFLKIYVG